MEYTKMRNLYIVAVMKNEKHKLATGLGFLLFFIALSFSQMDDLHKAYMKEVGEMQKTYAKERDDQQRIYFQNYIKSQWEIFRKVPGVSLPASPDSLKIKTIGIPKIKKDENPNIEIINALLKEGIDTTSAVGIALEIIDSLGIDAIREGQSIGIASERNRENRPVIVSYKVDSAETSTLLQSKTEGYKYVENREKPVVKKSCAPRNLQYVFPLKNSCRKTSGFGMREHPILKRQKKHEGVDYAAARNTEVYAIAGGSVAESSFSQTNGHYVAIKHADGMLSYYLHLNEKGVNKGLNVDTGQAIGKAGSSGLSTGPHLHLGIKKNGIWQDPEKVLGM
jgi:murein DD-endopeptidase MepM/ murein hydrolase activator NlpD